MKTIDRPFQIPMPSFVTAACVIEDQLEYLVLAVRIPKVVIEANRGL